MPAVPDRVSGSTWNVVGRGAGTFATLWVTYALVVLLATYPLASLLTSGDGHTIFAFAKHPDTDGTLWFHWWFGHALDNGLPLFQTPYLSFPQGEDLWLTCGNVVLLALLYPVFELFGPVGGYNASAWLILTLNCCAGYLLVQEALGSRAWGICGGALIGVNNFLLCELREGRLEQLFIVWLLLALWASLRLASTHQRRYAASLALLYALTALTSWHYGIMLSMVLGLWVALEATRRRWRWIKLALAGLAGGLLLILPGVVMQYSAMASAYSWDIAGGAAEGARGEMFREMSFGALKPGQLLFSAACCQPALGVLLLVVAAAGCLSRTVRQRAKIWLWLCPFVLAWALGPVWGAWRGGDQARLPFYYLAEYVPVMARFLWPERYILFIYISATVVGLMALKAGWDAGGHLRKVSMMGLLAAVAWAELYLVGTELWSLRPQTIEVPRVYRELATMPPRAVLELPPDGSNLYLQTFHQKPAFMSSLPYPQSLVTRKRLQFIEWLGLEMGQATVPGAATVKRLKEAGFGYVIVHEEQLLKKLKYDHDRWRQMKRRLDELLGTPRRYGDGEQRYLYVFNP